MKHRKKSYQTSSNKDLTSKIKRIFITIIFIFLFFSLTKNLFDYRKTITFYESFKQDYEKEKKRKIELKTNILKSKDPYEIKNYKHEVIFIDDGSTDNTDSEIKKYTSKNSNIKLISFYRNFGHQMALSCGYSKASGDCIISMDSDLQDPPEIIQQMINKWKSGSLVVYAKRKTRNVDNLFKRISATFFYNLMNFLSDVPIPKDVGDFRLLDKKIVDYLNSLPEQSKFLRGLVAWGGFPASFVSFDREKRNSGETHYSFGKMVNFALDGIISFSVKPLRLATFFGFLAAFIGFLGMLYAIIGKFYFPQDLVSGWAAIFVGLMFLGGVVN